MHQNKGSKVFLPSIKSPQAGNHEMINRGSNVFPGTPKVHHSENTESGKKVQFFEDISDSPNRQTRSKVEDIIKKNRSKIMIGKKGKTELFDEKMRVFDNLATFVDVKGTLQQMNTAINKKVDILNPSQFSNFNVPNGKRNASMPDIPQYWLENRSPTEMTREKVARYIDEKSRYVQDVKRENAKSSTNLDPTPRDFEMYKGMMSKATFALAERADEHRGLSEDTDGQEFYYKLSDNLIKDRYERPDNYIVQLTEDEKKYVEHYKRMLEFNPEENEINNGYYADYKTRADKVIGLLKKATKHIFNKVLKTKDRRGPNKEEVETLKKSVKKNFDNILEKYDMNSQIFEEPSQNISMKFSQMNKKIDMLVKKQQSDPGVRKELDNIQMTRQINTMYKQYMNKLINEADNQKLDYKSVRAEIGTKIDNLEHAYERDLDTIFPKEMESIRMNLGTKSHFATFGTQPMRKFSKRVLGAIMTK